MAIADKTLPLPNDNSEEPAKGGETEPVLNLLRQKISGLYQDEPSIKEEEKEIEAVGASSKHQKYIEELMNSDKDMAQIQTDWHNYYQSLSDTEKHQVWQEFYANNQRGSRFFSQQNKEQTPTKAEPNHQPTQQMVGSFETSAPKTTHTKKLNKTTMASLKKQLLSTVIARGKLSKKHHLKALLFGLSMGLLVVFILMFTFFNERFIAPFITPSHEITDTPIIIDPTADNTVATDPLVIIPKINVEVPVVYGLRSIAEDVIHDALDNGVVHYPTTPVPGQNGNVVIVGHSSNNIFNRGKYKFAFVLLSRLEVGDTFMLHYNSKRYIYRVYDKKIVTPTDVSVLGPTDKNATATLITCDPPGTAAKRLVVIGEQISPATDSNIAADTSTITEEPDIVPGNAESLFHRLFSWIWE